MYAAQMATAWERFQQKTMHGNVVLNFTPYPKGDLAVYGGAYREAADTLVRDFEKRKGYSDADACPIAFLYRHSIELYLKAIILWGAGLVRLQSGEELNTENLLNTHKLGDLLPNLKRIFKEAHWLDETETETKFGTYKKIEEFILAFEAIDPNSFAFRYPVDKKGDASLPESFHFNVITLGHEASEMLKALEGAACGVYEMFQEMAAIQREYSSYGAY